ncbi:MAG: hypothetical protein IPK26_20665 [Planctomycetes bacterium]|nr:hypothetical protein [Planctomycetota bacterium]
MLSRWSFVAFLFTSLLSAQTLTVPGGTLVAGSEITVGYSDPAKAGKTVTVDVNDALPPAPNRGKILIQLDEHGNGQATWIVPYWEVALFNAPDVPEEARFVAPWAPRR